MSNVNALLFLVILNLIPLTAKAEGIYTQNRLKVVSEWIPADTKTTIDVNQSIYRDALVLGTFCRRATSGKH